MRTSFLAILLALVSVTASAQAPDPVKWTFSAKKIANGQYEVHLTAALENGWHIYSQTTPDGGPVKTTITFSKNPLVTLQGNITESGKLEQHFDDLFDVEVKQFSNQVDFVQKLTVKANAKTNLSGSLNFMTCNNTMCLPPKTVSFAIALK